jgi:hypothetical protein
MRNTRIYRHKKFQRFKVFKTITFEFGGLTSKMPLYIGLMIVRNYVDVKDTSKILDMPYEYAVSDNYDYLPTGHFLN